ncbi:MAG: putative Ig domain-containing protein [Gemmatimonadetes bacterium]|nr:putative Ig domain-containing protein [Gemmatimonadota bacterium]
MALLGMLLAACAGDQAPGPLPPPLAIDTTTAIPAVVGEAFSHTFTATGGSGPYVWSIGDGALPQGVGLSPAGVLSGTPNVVEQRTFTVRVTSGTATASRGVTLAVDYPPVVFTTTTVPVALWGRAYFALLQATGGTPGSVTAWSLAGGALPAGVTLSASGSLGGIPTSLGPHAVRLRATRGTRSAELDLQVRVDAPALVMETTALPDARAGQLYLVNLQATGGVGAYTWRLTGGRLPTGLTFAADGSISGTPASEDSVGLSVEVTSGTQQLTRSLGLLVEPETYPATALVTMPGDVFSPFLIRVRPGGTVTWRFGASPHNVIFAVAPGAPANIDIVSSVDVSRVFPRPGEYRYDCTIHPGMAGRVEVR